jgi:shikimate kinase
MNLILFGYKGAGKTHFGKLLSLETKRPFIDTDELIVEMAGKPVREIYLENEKKFRAIEKEALQKLNGITNTIIAVGGGTVLDPENVAFLQSLGRMIYLRSTPKNDGPFFDPARELIYRAIPATCIDVDTDVLAQLRKIDGL